MNELSDLIIKDKAEKYIVSLNLTPNEYKILMFCIEDHERIYTKTIPLGESFKSLKEKIIMSHVLNNVSQMRTPCKSNKK